MWRQLVNRGQSFRSAGWRCSRRCTVQRGSWFPLLCAALTAGSDLMGCVLTPQRQLQMQTQKPRKHKDILGCVDHVCSLDCGDGAARVWECARFIRWHAPSMCVSLWIADAFKKLVGKTGLQRTHPAPWYDATGHAECPWNFICNVFFCCGGQLSLKKCDSLWKAPFSSHGSHWPSASAHASLW